MAEWLSRNKMKAGERRGEEIMLMLQADGGHKPSQAKQRQAKPETLSTRFPFLSVIEFNSHSFPLDHPSVRSSRITILLRLIVLLDSTALNVTDRRIPHPQTQTQSSSISNSRSSTAALSQQSQPPNSIQISFPFLPLPSN